MSHRDGPGAEERSSLQWTRKMSGLATGSESAIPSSRTGSRWTAEVGVWPYALVRAFVVVVWGSAGGGLSLDRLPDFSQSSGGPGCAGIPSRKLRSAGPRPAGPGRAPRRTYDLDQPGAVWLPPVRDGPPSWAGHPGVAGVQGRSPGR